MHHIRIGFFQFIQQNTSDSILIINGLLFQIQLCTVPVDLRSGRHGRPHLLICNHLHDSIFQIRYFHISFRRYGSTIRHGNYQSIPDNQIMIVSGPPDKIFQINLCSVVVNGIFPILSNHHSACRQVVGLYHSCTHAFRIQQESI